MPNRTLTVTIDVVCVLTFVAVGRSAHAEGLALAGLARTAWPFLVGLACGELIGPRWSRPAAPWSRGAVSVACTVAIGMVLRVASGQSIAIAFVFVATAFLSLFLLGWRLVAFLITKRRAAR